MQVPVCIIGCGPIGLAGALLLSRFGVKALLLERRGGLNTHPRSRFVDTNTMELLRELGVEKEVEATGLGPDWTEFNRWSFSLASEEYARIPSPTFHTAPRASSPCMPVMTAQDLVENALLGKAQEDPNIELRFHTEAQDITQTASEARLTLRNLQTGAEEAVSAAYIIGADGPSSPTRVLIGSELEGTPMAMNSQDVIFDADLAKHVGARKGALLYATPRPGIAVIFQPLDGVRRWRCQVNVPTPKLLGEAEIIGRIREALGTQDETPIKITSMSLWQPTPGCATLFQKGRIFLAGDAAHVAVPTGGLGNNTGFAGIRNLCWKLAFVLRSVSPPSLLDTYQEEHKPLAQSRIDIGVAITQAMIPMMIKATAGEDIDKDIHGTRHYGNYDGALLGFELKSALIAAEPSPPPKVKDALMDFVPAVRAGRRAPHIWLDEAGQVSLLDGFGASYSLILGADVNSEHWTEQVQRLADSGFPISTQQLPKQPATSPYASLALIRPDGIIADHWRDSELAAADRQTRLTQHLPLR